VKQPNVFFKLGALGTSVLLVGGFVCYRAGAFNRFLAADAPPADPASNPALDPTLVSTATAGGTAAGEPQNISTIEHILFYTSKSGTIIPPPAVPTSPSAIPDQGPTLMPGSKFIGNVISVDQGSLSTTPPAAKPSSPGQPPARTAPILMPGSKSLAPIQWLPGINPPAAKPPAVEPAQPQNSTLPR
jgi:hypothetical protein